eukprot:310181-Alexandrium_andersonii.AAC.1
MFFTACSAVAGGGASAELDAGTAAPSPASAGAGPLEALAAGAGAPLPARVGGAGFLLAPAAVAFEAATSK